MKAKLVTFGITAVAIIALALQASSQAVAQGNANKPAPAKKAKPAATKKNANMAPPPTAQAAPAQAAAPAAAKHAKKPVHRKKPTNAMAGVPSGVSNCIKHLSEMASKDPLIMFEGHPEEVVNNGLLWNDPKSKCSVGSDENMRQKVFDLATNWRMKDAAKVRSILQELEGMSPK
jgi:hypothetical protein